MKKAIVLVSICFLLLATYFLFKKNNADKNNENSLYAGSETCMKCHSDISKSYMHTAHYIASLPANENTVHGSFSNGFNVFNVSDSQEIVMQKSGSGMFQSYYLNNKLKERYRFDVVFGGVKGESYLYWKGNELYQLPISYYTAQKEWSTSPGYGPNFLQYPSLRSIKKQCMECHASYIKDLPAEKQAFRSNEQFDKTSLVFGVNCERCHGPAAAHVEYQSLHPQVKTARFITSYTTLNRIQQIDMCAICHSGKPVDKIKSTFEFVPGDTFANYKLAEPYQQVDTSKIDVHGNQVQLLKTSKCYLYSNLTCTTCHDPHENNRNNNSIFVEKCLNCHNEQSHIVCKLDGKQTNEFLKVNCINCHMPALSSNIISVKVSQTSSPIKFYVHTHHIATYPQEVQKILAMLKK